MNSNFSTTAQLVAAAAAVLFSPSYKEAEGSPGPIPHSMPNDEEKGDSASTRLGGSRELK